jgi:hypothetical protein
VAESGRKVRGDRWRALAAALVLVALAACSGDDGAGAGPRTEDTTTAEATGETDGGTIYDTVPPVTKPQLDPVPLDATAEFGDGVTAGLTALESVEVEAFMPGEISGPGVAVTVELVNGSSAPIDLGNVAVELVATGDRYATLITMHENAQLRGELAPGATAEGTYVFTLAAEDRADVVVQVSYAAPKPTALFQGSLSDV